MQLPVSSGVGLAGICYTLIVVCEAAADPHARMKELRREAAMNSLARSASRPPKPARTRPELTAPDVKLRLAIAQSSYPLGLY